MQVLLLIALFVFLTVGLLGAGFYRAKRGQFNTTATAISMAISLSTTVLAASVAISHAWPTLHSGPSKFGLAVGEAVLIAAAAAYAGTLGWFLWRHAPPSPATLVISGVVFAGPLWFVGTFVWLLVGCLFGDCI
jgi:hypothetical protein